MRIVKKIGWDMDESLQSYTMNKKQNYWYECNTTIRDIKRFLLVAGGIRDSAD